MASFTSSSERSMWALALAALLVLAVAYLNNASPDPKYDETRNARTFWQHKVFGLADGIYNIVLSGDSRIYRGLAPAQFDAVLKGTKTFNFGFSGGGHNPLIFREIDRILNDDPARTHAVVLGITPYSLTPKAQMNAEYLDYKAKGPPASLQGIYDWFRPLSFSRLKKLAAGKTAKPSNEVYSYGDDGWVRSDWVKRDTGAELANYKANFDGNRVDQAAIDAVISKTADWAAQGIIVVAFRPPTTPAMIALENTASGFNETAFKAAFRAAGGLWVEAGQHYETYDGSHLTPESGEQLSKIIASAIEAAARTH